MSSIPAESDARNAAPLSHKDYETYGPLVRRTAIYVGRRVPSQVAVNELVAHGWLGLMAAFQRAAPEMGAKEFEAYASYRIRGAVLDFIRSLDPAAKAARGLSRRIAATMADATTTLGRTPEEDEIAGALAMSVEQFRAALLRVADAGMARLEIWDFDQMESGQVMEEPAAAAPGEAVEAAIQQLPILLAQVLALYCQEECTFAEIAEIMCVSEIRARQMHSEAIHRVRALIGRT